CASPSCRCRRPRCLRRSMRRAPRAAQRSETVPQALKAQQPFGPKGEKAREKPGARKAGEEMGGAAAARAVRGLAAAAEGLAAPLPSLAASAPERGALVPLAGPRKTALAERAHHVAVDLRQRGTRRRRWRCLRQA